MEIDSGTLSTKAISVVTAIAGFIVLYPDLFEQLGIQIGLPGRVIAAAVMFATIWYNYKNPRQTTEVTTESEDTA